MHPVLWEWKMNLLSASPIFHQFGQLFVKISIWRFLFRIGLAVHLSTAGFHSRLGFRALWPPIEVILRWIKEWVLVTCGVLWVDLVFSSIFLYFNRRPLCLRPEPLWTLNTPFLDHMTSHAHNYAKFGLCRLHQFTESDHNSFSFHNISFTVK